jgi:hypothetical protein
LPDPLVPCFEKLPPVLFVRILRDRIDVPIMFGKQFDADRLLLIEESFDPDRAGTESDLRLPAA